MPASPSVGHCSGGIGLTPGGQDPDVVRDRTARPVGQARVRKDDEVLVLGGLPEVHQAGPPPLLAGHGGLVGTPVLSAPGSGSLLRRALGLMDRQQAAEHEHLIVLPHARLADRVRGPVPDDIWVLPARSDSDAA